MASADNPNKVTESKKQTYATDTTGLRYPLELGTGEYHSYINFKVVQRPSKLYTSEEGEQNTKNAGTVKNISLYIPETVSVAQSSQWETQGGAAAAAAMTDGGFFDKIVAAGKSLAGGAATSAANFLSDGAGDVLAQEAAGLARNAAKIQLFRGIEFRQFEYEYKFVASSEKESKEIAEIIRIFRKHMLPDIKGDYYSVPDTFDIEYRVMGKGPESTDSIHKIKSCALTSCQVSYGGDGSFGVYYDGTPVNISMNLTFLELQQVTKKDIDEGY